MRRWEVKVLGSPLSKKIVVRGGAKGRESFGPLKLIIPRVGLGTTLQTGLPRVMSGRGEGLFGPACGIR